MTAPDTKAIRAQMEALTGFTVGPWYAHNLPGDWGLRGAYSIHVACANPHEWDPCIAQVEYQTPYCLGKKAARTAACNARLIAAAPDMHATILALCDALDTEQSKVRRMGREVNHAKYGQPDFARGIHLETTAELNAENERLRAALETFADADKYYDSSFDDDYSPRWAEFFTIGDFRRARAALASREAPPAAQVTVAEAARVLLAQPKAPDSPLAGTFRTACAYLEAQECGAETTNEIIEAFLRALAGDGK